MYKKVFIILALSSISFFSNSNEGDTNWREITGFGCHLSDGTCYFYISGDPVGNPQCLKTDVRFNVLNSPNGKTWLALIQSAYIADKKVRLNISGCYGNYPTFSYGRLSK